MFLCLQMPKISPHVHARDTFVPRYSLNKKHGGRSGDETNKLRKDYVKLNEETGTLETLQRMFQLFALFVV